jgi:subtilisin family serine protease
MRYLWILAAVAMVIAVSNLSGVIVSPQAQAGQPTSFVPGELLVKLKVTDDTVNTSAIHTRVGAVLKNDFPAIGWQHVILPEGLSVESAVAAYKIDPNVDVVQPNFVYRISATPNDPMLSDLYGMERISATRAWDTTTGDANNVVAVIDTGIDRTHPDLSANVWQNPGETPGNGIDDDANGYVDDTYGWDFLNGDNEPVDGHSHGTHCSGTIGGVGNNGVGVVGVNWNVKIMALKTHDDIAGGSTSVTLLSTFGYVTMMKNRGINIRATSNSYGGPPEAAAYDQALRDAIDASGRAGILNVFAAGNQLTVSQENNNDQLPTYPGSYNSPSILAVAASDQNDNKASFSHYGLTTVDVAAPGVGIRSTVPGNGYDNFSGTSMSTPHTAGAAALLAAAHPKLSSASLKATLMNTVDVLPQWAGFISTGGRINIANAIANPTICSYDLSSKAMSFTLQGGTGTFQVSSATNCGFDAYSDKPWIRVTSQPGITSGTVEYSVLPNYSVEPRTATLVVAGRLYTVTQAGLGPLLPTSSVSGRVLTTDGKGINKAVVKITDSTGFVRQISTSTNGFYRFDNVATGRSYTLVAEHKKYEFEKRTIILIGNAENVDFVGRSN